MLLVASYIFYGAWDWRFLSLLLVSTAIDYFCGLKIDKAETKREKKIFLTYSIVSNLFILGFFKYFNFFLSSLQDLCANFGLLVPANHLNIILPVGISFYTFQTMSYTIDVYRKEMKPTGNFLDFALFVSFFPQLVAGPIERAQNLLPQVLMPRKVTLEKVYHGCFLIFYGLFQKMFIADNLAKIVDPAFAQKSDYNGAFMLIATYAFAFQLYCDFAGYSNIARGLGKCMGFEIMINFRQPYFATNPREFWQRWHISLSSWLRDYVYIPLGGNRRGKLRNAANLMLTMFLGGIWHGAAWNFFLWGIYQGVLLTGHRMLEPLLKKIPLPENPWLRFLSWAGRVFLFFNLWCAGLVIFRAQSLRQISRIFYSFLHNFSGFSGYELINMIFQIGFLILVLIIAEAIQLRKNDPDAVYNSNFVLKAALYYACFYLLLLYGVYQPKQFIYFVF